MNIRNEYPACFSFLYEPHRYKVRHGGRGGGGSWSFARALVVLGLKHKLRIVCAREYQKSIETSSKQTIEDQISLLGIDRFYERQKYLTVGHNGTEIRYLGLQDPASLKSLEGCDILWIEEAAGLTKGAWDIIDPTVRKPATPLGGPAEIWLTFNPELETDFLYQKFVVGPAPSDCVVVYTTFADNRWFPDNLEAKRQDSLNTDTPEDYAHIWLGRPKSSVSGAIYSAQIQLAEQEQRICSLVYDKTIPVNTYWDLGFEDYTAIWFVQHMRSGQIRLIDYLENRGKPLTWYLGELQHRGYVYGINWLPWDGVSATTHNKLTTSTTQSPEMIMRDAGWRVRLAATTHIGTQINAGREVFDRCWFDRARCLDGLQALRHYAWESPLAAEKRKDQPWMPHARKPIHNWASHGSSAFNTMAIVIRVPDEMAARNTEYPFSSPPASNNERWV